METTKCQWEVKLLEAFILISSLCMTCMESTIPNSNRTRCILNKHLQDLEHLCLCTKIRWAEESLHQIFNNKCLEAFNNRISIPKWIWVLKWQDLDITIKWVCNLTWIPKIRRIRWTIKWTIIIMEVEAIIIDMETMECTSKTIVRWLPSLLKVHFWKN
jgi:hypothetical protein